jgi:hypothetical protein
VNSDLAGLSLNQEASQKELEGVPVRKMALLQTSPRRSGGSESAGKNISTSPGPKLKKASLSITVLFLLKFSGN